MKYYRVTAYTMYCGEEMTDYIATEDLEELQEFTQNLCEDNAAEWKPNWADYAENGYESEEEWQEDYYSSASATVVEITEEEYKEETKPKWPFELIKEGPGWEG